jgi:hypothetical protein
LLDRAELDGNILFLPVVWRPNNVGERYVKRKLFNIFIETVCQRERLKSYLFTSKMALRRYVLILEVQFIYSWAITNSTGHILEPVCERLGAAIINPVLSHCLTHCLLYSLAEVTFASTLSTAKLSFEYVQHIFRYLLIALH